MGLLYCSGAHDCPNPWWVMDHPTLKGVSTTILYTSCSHSLKPLAVNQRKIIKGKRHMNNGGKIKVGVTHVPRLLPSIHYLPKCRLPFVSDPCTLTCDSGLPLHPLLCSITLSHVTTIWRMYQGHTIPFKSRSHPIRYLVNPPWSLETLAHATTHYGRACHYEVPTCCPLFVNYLTWFL